MGIFINIPASYAIVYQRLVIFSTHLMLTLWLSCFVLQLSHEQNLLTFHYNRFISINNQGPPFSLLNAVPFTLRSSTWSATRTSQVQEILIFAPKAVDPCNIWTSQNGHDLDCQRLKKQGSQLPPVFFHVGKINPSKKPSPGLPPKKIDGRRRSVPVLSAVQVQHRWCEILERKTRGRKLSIDGPPLEIEEIHWICSCGPR